MERFHLGKKIKLLLTTIGIFFFLICFGFLGAGLYFYHVAVVPGKKNFLSKQKISKSSPLYPGTEWYKNAKKYRWTQMSTTDHLKLVANYLPADKKTNKTVIVAHGYMGNKEQMAPYAYIFHKMGYNVLTPDTRGHGQSQGNYVGYGWPDRMDYIKWMRRVIEENGKDSEMVMFGVSMGGATTMMVSGEKSVPKQLKAYIEDCGYTSVADEINYEAKQLYHLSDFPRWPLVPIVSGITHLRAGYSMYKASALNQVKKNHKPILFIHGDNDNFVPTRMVHPLYEASRGPKQLLLVKKAAHASSYKTDPQLYVKTIKEFLSKYFN
ncbi:alpha/beta hydrolase [Apilactobacillus apisilvae]|uniref:Alpha/beta hydrolase n=1 Tax=Apilactobacillus apisilvae TaxID=2923364 RepID=A0ABY4PGD1_9LACO|nr:alpha/beta hydrolase [Apilactobacillus apisilvae]UQS84553.1 alpha/beta hydrolase [Apilactobacillus apisilvae]